MDNIAKKKASLSGADFTGAVSARHMEGKRASGSEIDELFLNYISKSPIYMQGKNLAWHAGNTIVYPKAAIALSTSAPVEMLRIHSNLYNLSGQLLVTARAYNESATTTYLLYNRLTGGKLAEIGRVNADTANRYITVSYAVENYVGTRDYDIVFYATSTQAGYAAAAFFGVNADV